MLHFFVKVVLISSSGALSPGPLSTSAIAVGLRKEWKNGLIIALGHSIIEFPLIIILAIGMNYFLQNNLFMFSLGIIGGGLLALFGALMIKDGMNADKNDLGMLNTIVDRPIIVGLTLTGFNPYFILWWFLVGGILIVDALALMGLVLGVVVLFVMHVWMDYAWLTFLAYMGNLGKNVLESRGYKMLLIVIGILFIVYAANLLSSLLFNIPIIPF